jgi:hypothetical protein
LPETAIFLAEEHRPNASIPPYPWCFVNERTLPHQASLPSFVHSRCTSKVNGMKTPQQLSREAIKEFKAIYQKEFGQSLTDDEVQEIALRLLRFFGILNQPIADENQDQAGAK